MKLVKNLLTVLAILLFTSNASAQPANHADDTRHDDDHAVFQYLLTNHAKIKRTVKKIPDGVETLTESDDAAVAAKIKEHVHWMQDRIEKVNPIRMRDPLFRELFQNAKAIKMVHSETEKGVKVTETSTDPKVVKLIQAHSKVVSGFVERGFAEAMKNHAVPNVEAGSAQDANSRDQTVWKGDSVVQGNSSAPSRHQVASRRYTWWQTRGAESLTRQIGQVREYLRRCWC